MFSIRHTAWTETIKFNGPYQKKNNGTFKKVKTGCALLTVT